MKTNYTLHGPRMPHFSRHTVEIALLIALIIVAALGVLLLLLRPTPAAAPAPAEIVAPAAVAPQYSDSLAALKADQAAQRADAALVITLPQAVTRAEFADFKAEQAGLRADAAMRMPAAAAVIPAPDGYVVSAIFPETQLIFARSRFFADEVIAGATYSFGGEAAPAMAMPQSGPR